VGSFDRPVLGEESLDRVTQPSSAWGSRGRRFFETTGGSMKVDEVKWWVIDRGISCVVVETKNGWCMTLCDTASPGEPTDQRTKRVCKRCRYRLSDAFWALEREIIELNEAELMDH